MKYLILIFATILSYQSSIAQLKVVKPKQPISYIYKFTGSKENADSLISALNLPTDQYYWVSGSPNYIYYAGEHLNIGYYAILDSAWINPNASRIDDDLLSRFYITDDDQLYRSVYDKKEINDMVDTNTVLMTRHDADSTINKMYTDMSSYLNSASSINPANVTQSSSYRFVTDAMKSAWDAKQDALDTTVFLRKTGASFLYQSKLVSGTNIKTVNGGSLLGSGDLTVSSTVSTPTSGISITSGTAFQPSTSNYTINITSTLSGSILALTGICKVEWCATQNGTYQEYSSEGMGLVALTLGVGTSKASQSITLPGGYWVKVTLTNTGGTVSATYTKVTQ